ncbi:MAG: DUF2478 domain-containing protein [Phyllobacteriaceae bacterium]|nr:DUF2478 domain-containing protein [Phyllobacteriaceae bacterium]
MTSPTPVPPLAVVVYEPGYAVEPLLDAVHDRLAARGDLRLGGVLPRVGAPLSNGKGSMMLESIATGVATVISQDLGAGSDSCTLDVDGMLRARTAIVSAIEEGVDLLFVGKFAKQEASGHCVREEIGEAMIAGIPTLVVMRETQRDAWTAFAGDDQLALPPDVDAIVAWALAVTGRAG